MPWAEWPAANLNPSARLSRVPGFPAAQDSRASGQPDRMSGDPDDCRCTVAHPTRARHGRIAHGQLGGTTLRSPGEHAGRTGPGARDRGGLRTAGGTLSAPAGPGHPRASARERVAAAEGNRPGARGPDGPDRATARQGQDRDRTEPQQPVAVVGPADVRTGGRHRGAGEAPVAGWMRIVGAIRADAEPGPGRQVPALRPAGHGPSA